MASEVNLQEFVAGFVLEAEEHLHLVNRNLVSVTEAIKVGRFDPRAVRELFRSLHTIKGLASMVGAGSIADIAHELEGILRAADRASGQLSESALDLLLKGTRAIEERVKVIPKVGVTGIPKASPRLLEELIHFQSNDHSTLQASPKKELELPDEILRALSPGDLEQALQGMAAQRQLVLIDFAPSTENIAAGLNITSVRERINKLAELIKVTPHSSPDAPTGIAFYLLILTDLEPQIVARTVGINENSLHLVQAKNITPSQPNEKNEYVALPEPDVFETSEVNLASNESSSVRVDIRKLDEILERLSDLIVTRSKLSHVLAKMTSLGVDTRELTVVVSENGRQLKRLRKAITHARMVSLSELLQRLPLIVRGLTKDTDKAVDIFIQAGSAEVDKAVADKIFPAIVHLVRNAVDHAIETKSERKQMGKDETGVITIHCDDSSGTTLTITVKDDGRGIDRKSVARHSDLPVAKSDDELLRQICISGLSTRDDVTLTSGRGMGMDIVKKTMEMLGGAIKLSTQEGKGTSFVMHVPVSITIVDVLSFISGDQVFVSPVAMIDEILEVNPAQLPSSPVLIKNGLQPRLLKRRGETIPFLVLDSILKNQPDRFLPTRALVVNHLNGTVAFGVDRLLGQQEVVIRPLEDSLVQVKGMNGAADLGDGHPTLVLDLASLGAEFTAIKEVSL